jgi:hypothetical protein
VIFPESFPSRNHTILHWDDNLGNSLPWVLLLIPNFTSILNWLLFEILTELDLEEVLCFMICMKLFQPRTQNVVWMRIWLDCFLVLLLLSFRGGYKRVLDNVVPVAISCLGVLTYGLYHISFRSFITAKINNLPINGCFALHHGIFGVLCPSEPPASHTSFSYPHHT